MKITDKMRLDFLADCSVGEGDAIFADQFKKINLQQFSKKTALRQAIDAAIKAERKRRDS